MIKNDSKANISHNNTSIEDIDLPSYISDYTLTKKLSTSKMSSTYVAHLSTNNRIVRVIKAEILRNDSPGTLMNESQILSQLDHEGIVNIYPILSHEDDETDKETKWFDVIETDYGSIRYIVLKYMPGNSLYDQIVKFGKEPLMQRDENSPLSLKNIVDTVEQIAQALEYLHERGYLHLDIKPGNILFSWTGNHVVLSDFGISQKTEEYYGDDTAGTVSYMSPERLDGWQVDKRSDIYSLGVILAEMLLGTKLNIEFGASSEPLTLHLEDSIKNQIKSLPSAIRKVVLKATRFDKENRYSTTGIFAKDLRRAYQRYHIQKVITGRILQFNTYITWSMVVLMLLADFLFISWGLAEVIYPWVYQISWFLTDTLTVYPWTTLITLSILTGLFIVYLRNRDDAMEALQKLILYGFSGFYSRENSEYDDYELGYTDLGTSLFNENDEYTEPSASPFDDNDYTEPAVLPDVDNYNIEDYAISTPLDHPSYFSPNAVLIYVEGGERLPKELFLRNRVGQEIRIGRRESFCDMTINDKRLSRLHATIDIRDGDGYYLRDEGSAGGTFINLNKLGVSNAKRIKHGDIIHFNAIAYRFELLDDGKTVDTGNL